MLWIHATRPATLNTATREAGLTQPKNNLNLIGHHLPFRYFEIRLLLPDSAPLHSTLLHVDVDVNVDD